MKLSSSAGLHCKRLGGLRRASGMLGGPQGITEGFQAKDESQALLLGKSVLGVGRMAGEGMATRDHYMIVM